VHFWKRRRAASHTIITIAKKTMAAANTSKNHVNVGA
jgi:hypothetical protein